MQVVFDSGPLIYLDVLGYLPSLEELYLVTIPGAVAEELAHRPRAPGGAAPSLDFVDLRSPEPENVRRVTAGPPTVDLGEREVLALALGGGMIAVMDDRAGRSRARKLGVTVTGTLGVLAALHYASHARRTLVEDLDALDAAGMYLTADLKRRVLDRFRAGDAPPEATR